MIFPLTSFNDSLEIVVVGAVEEIIFDVLLLSSGLVDFAILSML